ncbi:hypothetical protein C8R44DRAFT_856716 [Mycena epipterygia]|nr:hypothetical protein C8R44DRAFT_856716 [Mycena epipterygia]
MPPAQHWRHLTAAPGGSLRSVDVPEATTPIVHDRSDNTTNDRRQAHKNTTHMAMHVLAQLHAAPNKVAPLSPSPSVSICGSPSSSMSTEPARVSGGVGAARARSGAIRLQDQRARSTAAARARARARTDTDTDGDGVGDVDSGVVAGMSVGMMGVLSLLVTSPCDLNTMSELLDDTTSPTTVPTIAPLKSEPDTDADIPPPSEYDALFVRLQESPHDPEGWKRLVDMAESDLETFEIGLNKVNAKKFITDLTPAYMQAPTVLRQLSTHLGGLGMPTGTGMFLPTPPTWTQQERPLMGRWKAYLEIEDKDRAHLFSRITMVYRKALIRMRYYPEIWHDEALATLKAGLEANPDRSPQRVQALLRCAASQSCTPVRPRCPSARSRPAADEFVKEPAQADPNSTEAKEGSGSMNQDELTERKKQCSNAWINYMRFACRAQGHKACREVFGKARWDEYITWECTRWQSTAATWRIAARSRPEFSRRGCKSSGATRRFEPSGVLAHGQ